MRGFRKLSASTLVAVVAGVVLLAAAVAPVPAARPPGAKPQERIKSFCIDFNWVFHPQRFAPPGTFAHADPKVHYQWFKDLGVNVIQTFCVTCNGYAWYRGSAVAPVQPGMKHDFLREITGLAHHDGIKVIGYFCVGANGLWAEKHPDQSHGRKPNTIHIPLTNEYLDYLTASIKDALIKTDIDGFQIDWVFSPPFLTDGKKIRWMECEQQMYGELFGQPFPGADKIDAKQATEFQRRAVARCWRRIHDAAKATRPNCIIWLISSELKSPQQAGSQMLREVDWLVNEHPNPALLESVRNQVGPHTKLIQGICGWEEHDSPQVVSKLGADVGFFGFARGESTATALPLKAEEAKPDVSAINARNLVYVRKLFHEGTAK